MAALRCIALIEGNKDLREALALVLTSTGGLEVHSYCSIDDYYQQDKHPIQLILLPFSQLKYGPSQLDHPFCYYGAPDLELSPPVPFIPLVRNRLAAFPEQLRQYYRQLI